MCFSDSDIRPNSVTTLDQVRVGSTSDARWRGIDRLARDAGTLDLIDVCSLDCTFARSLTRRYDA